jgi:ABC-2 type transport system ATP-binding protein
MMGAIIEARDLAKRFDGFPAVDHISFAVPEGVIFGFLGLNGAGKTTTVKMLTKVLKPSQGRLSIVDDDPVKEPLLVRCAFGIVFQDPSLDGELTAAENMELHGVFYRVPRAERRERVEALLRCGSGATTTSSVSRAA